MSTSLQDFKGRLFVVTGGGAGIGLAVSTLLAERGASVIVAEHNEDSRHTVEALRQQGLDLYFTHCDVRDEASVDALFDCVARQGQPLAGLVNNAGITVHGDFLDFPLSQWEALVNTNLRSVFLCTQRAARLMKDRGGGSVVNIASNHAGATNPGFDAYAATKAGVCAMTRAMAWSLGGYAIRVNSLSPGLTQTPHIEALIDKDPALGAFWRTLHATQRFNQPEDVAEIVAFLLSDVSMALTGTDLLADNGMSARLFNRPSSALS